MSIFGNRGMISVGSSFLTDGIPVFLFGQSYGCFDPGKLRDYYRVSEREYVMVPGRRDYFYETGIKQLLCLIRKNRERQELCTA